MRRVCFLGHGRRSAWSGRPWRSPESPQRPSPPRSSGRPPATAGQEACARSPTSGSTSCPAWSPPRPATSSINDGTDVDGAQAGLLPRQQVQGHRRAGPLPRQRPARPRGPGPRQGRQDALDRRHRRQRRQRGRAAARVALWTMPVDGRQAADAPPADLPRRQAARRRGAAARRRRHAAHHHQGPPARPRSTRPTGGAEGRTPTTGVPLKKVGEFTLPKTEHRRTRSARSAGSPITGAARSPDGNRWSCAPTPTRTSSTCSGGDVVEALTTGKPRITAAAERAVGEAITYTPDGKPFLTVSDVGRSTTDEPIDILSYTPSTVDRRPRPRRHGAAEPARRRSPGPTADPRRHHLPGRRRSGVVGLLLVVAGIVGIRRARRRPSPRRPTTGRRRDDEPADGEPAVGDRPVRRGGRRSRRGAPAAAAVYGRRAAPGRRPGLRRPARYGRPAGYGRRPAVARRARTAAGGATAAAGGGGRRRPAAAVGGRPPVGGGGRRRRRPGRPGGGGRHGGGAPGGGSYGGQCRGGHGGRRGGGAPRRRPAAAPRLRRRPGRAADGRRRRPASWRVDPHGTTGRRSRRPRRSG